MTRGIEPGRTLRGLLAGIGGVALVTAVCLPFRHNVTPATPGLLYILAVAVAAVVGGRLSAVAIALLAAVTYSIAFIPPVGTFRVELREDLVGLVVFVAVGLTMGTLVGREAARRRQAEQREREIVDMYDRYQAAVAEQERLAAEAQRVEVLEEVDRQRKVLLRLVSHDLRTPLATIRTVTSGMRAGVPYDDQTRAELLELVDGEVERLDRLVANVLSLGQIESGRLQPKLERLAVGDLVDDAVHRLQRSLPAWKISVSTQPALPPVDADPTLLDLVLTNLLENAARHSPAERPILVDVSADEAYVRVAVVDWGPGLDPLIRDDPFVAYATGPGGSTGIGLATSKAIIEAHGGTITAGDNLGGGACFAFTLQVAR